MENPSSPPRSPPRARWLLIAGAVFVGLLLVWIVAQAAAHALAPYADLLAVLLIGFVALLGAGLVRIVFAFGRRLEAQARQQEIVQLQNGQPVHVLDVTPLATRLAARTLDRHYDVEQARAERSQYPQLGSIHQAIRIDAPSAPALAAPSVAPALPVTPVIDPGRPLLAQLRDRGHVCRSGNSLLVGYDQAGQPLYIEMPECGFIGVGGQPRVGKTTLVTLLLAQVALLGWHLAIADPHIHKEDGLINRCTPISGHTIRQTVTPEEVAAMVRFVDKIGRARVNGDRDRTPVMMVIDEFSNFVIRGLLPDDVLAALPAMAMEYAGVGVHGLIIGHDWNARLLGGDLGAALRRAITHRLVCRSDAGNAEFLLPNAALARQAASLAKGQALYSGTEAPAIVTVPRLGAEDLTYAAQGVPPRPYAPRATIHAGAQSTPIPPTTRVSAPPTQQLPDPTVPEQIVDLLARQQTWLTSTEIAQALRVDLKVIQTELTPLVRRRAIERRSATRSGPEKYEYAVNQSINAPFAVSA